MVVVVLLVVAFFCCSICLQLLVLPVVTMGFAIVTSTCSTFPPAYSSFFHKTRKSLQRSRRLSVVLSGVGGVNVILACCMPAPPKKKKKRISVHDFLPAL